MASTPIVKTLAKTNYLNNRDILKQIHLSKNTYCSYLDPVNDHQYDIILPTVEKINQRTIAEARRNRADRIKRETGVVVDPKKIPNAIFRNYQSIGIFNYYLRINGSPVSCYICMVGKKVGF